MSLGAIPRATQDEAESQRTMDHMNKNHVQSLNRFLAYYKNANDTHDVRLTSIALDSMTIAYSSGRADGAPPDKECYLLIDPPMKSWKEARERMVAMDAECTAAGSIDTKQSAVVIDRYRPPSGFRQIAGLVFTFAMLSVFGRKRNFAQGTLLRRIQPWMLYSLIGGHTVRLLLFLWTRLRRNGVRAGSGVWWMWAVSQYVEGWPCQQRFDRMVDDEARRLLQ